MAPFAALAAAYGTYLLYTSLVLHWPPTRRPAARAPRAAGSRRLSLDRWMAQAGLAGVRPIELAAVVAIVAAVAGVAGWTLFGAAAPALGTAAAGGAAPVGIYRARRARLREQAREAWPRLIEDVRVQTSSLGRSIPVALLDAGRRSPVPTLRDVFAAAQREWVLSTDFERTIALVKAELADATADMVCETLLVAHQVGGADIDRRLTALTEDRVADLDSRRDAEARQAGARFARWFVLAAPAGMALVGLSIGDGRAAYRSSGGQVAVLAGVVTTAACWVWASAIMRLPDQDRVFG